MLFVQQLREEQHLAREPGVTGALPFGSAPHEQLAPIRARPFVDRVEMHRQREDCDFPTGHVFGQLVYVEPALLLGWLASMFEQDTQRAQSAAVPRAGQQAPRGGAARFVVTRDEQERDEWG